MMPLVTAENTPLPRGVTHPPAAPPEAADFAAILGRLRAMMAPGQPDAAAGATAEIPPQGEDAPRPAGAPADGSPEDDGSGPDGVVGAFPDLPEGDAGAALPAQPPIGAAAPDPAPQGREEGRESLLRARLALAQEGAGPVPAAGRAGGTGPASALAAAAPLSADDSAPVREPFPATGMPETAIPSPTPRLQSALPSSRVAPPPAEAPHIPMPDVPQAPVTRASGPEAAAGAPAASALPPAPTQASAAQTVQATRAPMPRPVVQADAPGTMPAAASAPHRSTGPSVPVDQPELSRLQHGESRPDQRILSLAQTAETGPAQRPLGLSSRQHAQVPWTDQNPVHAGPAQPGQAMPGPALLNQAGPGQAAPSQAPAGAGAPPATAAALVRPPFPAARPALPQTAGFVPNLPSAPTPPDVITDKPPVTSEGQPTGVSPPSRTVAISALLAAPAGRGDTGSSPTPTNALLFPSPAEILRPLTPEARPATPIQAQRAVAPTMVSPQMPAPLAALATGSAPTDRRPTPAATASKPAVDTAPAPLRTPTVTTRQPGTPVQASLPTQQLAPSAPPAVATLTDAAMGLPESPRRTPAITATQPSAPDPASLATRQLAPNPPPAVATVTDAATGLPEFPRRTPAITAIQPSTPDPASLATRQLAPHSPPAITTVTNAATGLPGSPQRTPAITATEPGMPVQPPMRQLAPGALAPVPAVDKAAPVPPGSPARIHAAPGAGPRDPYGAARAVFAAKPARAAGPSPLPLPAMPLGSGAALPAARLSPDRIRAEPVHPAPDTASAAPAAQAVLPPGAALVPPPVPIDQTPPGGDQPVDLIHRLDAPPRAEAMAEPRAGTTPALDTAQRIAQQIAARLDVPGPGTFDLALQPEELGQVRLKLVSHDAGSLLIVQAERPETLDLMRRHIGVLEQDLRALGHDQLSLRFSGGHAGDAGQRAAQHAAPQAASEGTPAADPRPSTQTAPAPPRARDHLDLRL